MGKGIQKGNLSNGTEKLYTPIPSAATPIDRVQTPPREEDALSETPWSVGRKVNEFFERFSQSHLKFRHGMMKLPVRPT